MITSNPENSGGAHGTYRRGYACTATIMARSGPKARDFVKALFKNVEVAGRLRRARLNNTFVERQFGDGALIAGKRSAGDE
ncbi:hypothetical protein KCP73_11220 [Salmonella enterica subsp. enterica]|nr:hypothetical protein KCP73_11220 [Salmonella enterica subsp. enterica]